MTEVYVLISISLVISIFGSIAYIRDTLKGKTKPNRVTWGLWAFTPLVAAAAAISAGADAWAAVRVVTSGLLPLVIFGVSFINKNSYWKLGVFDGVCGTLGIIALMLWLLVDQPILAIILLIIGDSFATLPTLKKAWQFPETETGLTFVAAILASLVIWPLIPEWNIENAAFQIYIVVASGLILFAIYRKKIFAKLAV